MTYSIAQAGRVQLGVYDASGRLMRRLVDGERRAGAETVVWNGTSESGSRLEPGVYFVRLAGPGTQMTRKIVLLR
jgi:flagellar hook assembly protein FlgD